MTNEATFQRAARREISYRDAAKQLLADDAQAREARRWKKPAWMPKPVVVISAVLFSLVLSLVFGIQKDKSS